MDQKFDYIEVFTGNNFEKVEPLPVSLEDLVDKCKFLIPDLPEKCSLFYIDEDSDQIEIPSSKDLEDLIAESSSPPKLYTSNLYPDLPSKRLEIPDEQPIDLNERAKYTYPNEFFYRLAQHIVNLANHKGPEKSADFFKIPVRVVKHLQIIGGVDINPYPLPYYAENEMPLSAKDCFRVVQMLKEGKILIKEIQNKFKVSETTVLKWIQVFSDPPKKTYLTIGTFFCHSFRQTIMKSYLLNKISRKEMKELYGLNDSIVKFWIFCEADPSNYSLEEIYPSNTKEKLPKLRETLQMKRDPSIPKRKYTRQKENPCSETLKRALLILKEKKLCYRFHIHVF